MLLWAALVSMAFAAPMPEPIRLADEHRLPGEPAVSRDGRWLAFASAGRGLWLRPLAGSAARQLTKEAASEPAFSPDGSTIAYGADSGIRLLRLDGGAARLIAPGGRRPRFSPDGSHIAFHTATGLFVIDAAGGSPRQLHPDMNGAGNAAWSADGRRLIFHGCRSGACDWWISTASGDGLVATGAAKLLSRHHLALTPPDLWHSGSIVFASAARLWTIRLNSETGQVEGAPTRLTAFDHDERSPAAAPDGRIVFASREENIDVYALPLDAGRAVVKGRLTRITNDASIDQRPSLSVDGGKLAWETSRGGNFEVRVKDLGSGEERAVTSGPLREHMPTLSRDGSRLLFDAHDGEKVTIFEAKFEGGAPVRIQEENVGQGSFQWSADGASALYFHREPPGSVGLLNLSTKQRTPLLRHPKYNLSLADARLSPDDRWIAFPVPYAPHRARLAVARLTGKVMDSEADWAYLTPETWNAWQPEWSPNGKWIYFLSDQSGKLAVQAAPARNPKSTPRTILSFPDATLTIAEMRPRDIGLAVAKDKLALAAAAYTATLWSVRVD